MAITNLNFTEDLTASNQIEPASMNGADINDITFEITLSVSTKEVTTKDEAKTVNDFAVKSFAAYQDSPELKELFQTRLYSTNTWSSGCNNDAYVGMTGVTLDFDHGFTIAEAQEAFADYNYILHTSRTHAHSEGEMPPKDRFRVILPFEPSGLYFTSAMDARRVYSKLMEMYPQADSSCTNPGRKFFPSTRELNTPFLLDVHIAGKYYSVEVSDVLDDEVSSLESRVWDGVLQPKSEMHRVLKFCPFVRWMEAHIDDPKTHISEPLKYCYISNLCWYEGGPERIHTTLARDVRPEKYDPAVVDDKIERVRQIGPHTYAKIAQFSKPNAALWGWQGKDWNGPSSPAGWGRFGRINSRYPLPDSADICIQYNDKLIYRTEVGWQVTTLDHLKMVVLRKVKKVQGVCPFCDDDKAEWATDTYHFTYLWCPHCQKRFYEDPNSPGLFAFKGELMRVETRSDKFISIEPLKKENFRTPKDWNYIRKQVLNDPDRKYLCEDFQIRRIGNVEFDHIGFEFDVNDNAIVYKYPARPAVIQDNALVDAFLEGLFGQYVDFIKDWMAMYCFTNYTKLPVIVLAGERFSGKNTFAEMMGKIFPNLMGYWDGDVCEFNPQFTSKLLFVDENRNATKPEQYVELKRITGNELIPINRKHKDVFYARNNLNIIFATNDARPVALKWGEEPTDERVNNFFVHWCTSAKVIDNELKFKLWDRIGHYVRTVLRERYEQLIANTDTRNRYFLAAPITAYARSLYASSKTSIEEETEILAECIVRGVIPRVPLEEPQPGDVTGPNFKPIKRPDKDEFHIPLRKLAKLIKALKLTASHDLKAYMNALIRMKIIKPEEYRADNKRYGYPILRPRSEYPESGPVIWDD